MASETFVSAMLLVTGVVAASILIVAVLPMIWGMVGTFSSASAATDRSMRTDFKIVTTYARYGVSSGSYLAGANVSVWMKNIGTTRISKNELKQSDVLLLKTGGTTEKFYRLSLSGNNPPWPFQRATGTNYLDWYYYLWEPTETKDNNYWDPGETLQIDAFNRDIGGIGQVVFFQFTLPNSVSRSAEFTAS